MANTNTSSARPQTTKVFTVAQVAGDETCPCLYKTVSDFYLTIQLLKASLTLAGKHFHQQPDKVTAAAVDLLHRRGTLPQPSSAYTGIGLDWPSLVGIALMEPHDVLALACEKQWHVIHDADCYITTDIASAFLPHLSSK